MIFFLFQTTKGPVWSQITKPTNIWTASSSATSVWITPCDDSPGKGIIGLGRVGCMRIGRNFTSWT